MRPVGSHSYAEVLFWGCNPSFVNTGDGVVMIDSPQQPMDALRWREQLSQYGPIRYIINTEPHYDHTAGNMYFPGTEVVGHDGLRDRYDKLIPMFSSDFRLNRMKAGDPDSLWLFNHPDYPPNPPRRTFDEQLTLQVGNYTFNCLHVPGHTAQQIVVHVPQDGVIFTGDNVFHHVKTWCQEGDPWKWIAALDRIGELDFEILVPGHGETCGKAYLAEQADILRRWVEVVSEYVDKGMSEDEVAAQPIDFMRLIDPYRTAQRQWEMMDQANDHTLRNIYKKIAERKGLPAR
jgi:glyoxylase-like metal-dependent hydrolase (beta-lactamase superfamily II)